MHLQPRTGLYYLGLVFMCDCRILIIFNSVTFVSFCFRCGGMTFSKSLNGSFESTQLVRNAKVDILFFSFIFLFYWSNIVCQKYKLTRTVFFFDFAEGGNRIGPLRRSSNSTPSSGQRHYCCPFAWRTSFSLSIYQAQWWRHTKAD